jgi:hypothetical protein
MNTQKLIGTILIIGSLVLGYVGADKIINNDASIEILDINIDVSNKSGKRQGFLYLGLAVVLFVGGVYTLRKESA